MKMKSIALLFGLLAASCVQSKTKNEWKTRNIYQLLTDRFAKSSGDHTPCADLHDYCGGDHAGITKNLQYIKDLGFNAIWISPVINNSPGGYHGYWGANWEEINSHFGNEDALKAMVETAHSMDIWVMVDVVANHVAPRVALSSIYPMSETQHYHPECYITDSSNQYEIENCRLYDLPDLNQQDPFVRSYLKHWI